MKRFPRLVLVSLMLLLLAVLMLPAGLVAAEDEPTALSDVTLMLLPEYDDPRLLVVIGGSIEGVTPPATVRFLVPADAEMYSAGSMDAQNNYLNPTGGPPNREPSEIDGWDEINYQVVTPVFRVEYYTALIEGRPDKTIAYDFHTRYDIDGLSVSIQQPLGAEDFSTQPVSTSKTNVFGLDGLFLGHDGLKQGEVLHYDISYTKSDPNPSVSSAPTGGSPAPSPSGGGDAGLITGGITGGLLIVAMITYVLFGRGNRRKPARARTASRAPAATPKAATKYCRQCGRQIEKSARYCQHCGAAQ